MAVAEYREVVANLEYMVKEILKRLLPCPNSNKRSSKDVWYRFPVSVP